MVSPSGCWGVLVCAARLRSGSLCGQNPPAEQHQQHAGARHSPAIPPATARPSVTDWGREITCRCRSSRWRVTRPRWRFSATAPSTCLVLARSMSGGSRWRRPAKITAGYDVILRRPLVYLDLVGSVRFGSRSRARWLRPGVFSLPVNSQGSIGASGEGCGWMWPTLVDVMQQAGGISATADLSSVEAAAALSPARW